MIKSLLELDWVIMVIDIGGQSYWFLCSGTVLSIPVSMLFIDLRLCKTGLNIEDIQIFGMNMPFISSSEAKNAYFMSGEATNEIYIFSLHEMK